MVGVFAYCFELKSFIRSFELCASLLAYFLANLHSHHQQLKQNRIFFVYNHQKLVTLNPLVENKYLEISFETITALILWINLNLFPLLLICFKIGRKITWLLLRVQYISSIFLVGTDWFLDDRELFINTILSTWNSKF